MRPVRAVRAAVAAAAVLAAVCLLPGGPAAPAQAEARSAAQRAVAIARGELARGVREVPDGSNRGSRIRMYGRSTTPRFYPAPWCAYFVSWVARRAGTPLGPSGRGFGYVPYIRAWARSTGRWHTTPRSGDLVMFPQHVGLVENVYSNGTLTTIEGNSSNRVARRWRRWREPSGYVRFASGGGVTRPGTPRPRPVKPVKQPLVARIAVHPSTTVAIGQKVGFSATDSSGEIVSYRWDLDGDGRFDDARGDSVERRYPRARTVNVGLRVIGRRGKQAVTRTRLNVRANQAPVAKLILPQSAPVNRTVLGHGEESFDPDGSIVKYEWDMDGDGRYEAGGDHHEFRFSRPGVYAAGLRVTDDGGAVSESVTTIRITHKPPVARAYGPSSAMLGQLVTFDGSGSYDPDGAVAAWRWDFDGDGTIDADGVRSSWRFSTPGSHRVKLLAVDEWGAESESVRTVNVVNRSPRAWITLPKPALTGTPLHFDGSRSTDSDSQIVRYQWDFDNDWVWDAEGIEAQHTYTGTGWRKVRLRVTDQWGARHTVYTYLDVLAAPQARPAVVTSDPTAGTSTAFSAAGSSDPDGYLKRLAWDFDSDGTVDLTTYRASTAASFVYHAPGSYLATLTVTDDDGLATQASVPVVVR